MGVRRTLHAALAGLACLALAGCAVAPRGATERPEVRTPEAATVRPAARPDAPGAGDAPAGRPAGGLGRTLASLGDPGRPGLWMATPLVDAVTPGRVVHAASGGTVRLELRPSGGAAGAGSQLSLDAFRALGLPLTALAELEVAAE